jgi:transposase
MPRRLSLIPHLSVDELEQRYRACRTPVERSHWHLLWLVALGHGVPKAAALVGYRADWARTLIHRYNTDGPAGLVDRRQQNRGRTPLLTPALRETLREALGGPAPDGGLWTGRKVAGWMAEQLGRPIGEVRGWEAMVALGFSPQRPRPRATTATPEAQATFKKGGSSAPSIP